MACLIRHDDADYFVVKKVFSTHSLAFSLSLSCENSQKSISRKFGSRLKKVGNNCISILIRICLDFFPRFCILGSTQ